MRPLVNEQEFIQATNLHRYNLQKAAGPLMKLTGISRLNEMYQEINMYEGLEFVDQVFKLLEINLSFDEDELKRIPQKGPFITVANHPFGLIDGLALLKLIARVRPDYKIMANFLLQHIQPTQDYFFSVNSLEAFQDAGHNNIPSVRNAMMHVQNGSPLGMFPSGEVSSYKKELMRISDGDWQVPSIKLIQQAEVPVVPIYFQGTNSLVFHLLGFLHPALQTVTLPAELLKKQRKNLLVRVGNPIPVREQKQFSSSLNFARYLRARTYSMGPAARRRKAFTPSLKIHKPADPVIKPVAIDTIEAELSSLRQKGKSICEQQEFEVFMAESKDLPAIMQEIGRLREITFREVGEGTNKAIDLDNYDDYYQHLFIWDSEAKKIGGAYRIGEGAKIMDRYGKEGFYIYSLFKIEDGFKPIMAESIELGRSFVCKEYQQKRLPLFLLWKGISIYLENNPACRYVMGPVSISNNYSGFSKSFMVAFLRKYYFDHDLAALVSPRKRFRPRFKQIDLETLLEGTSDDVKKVDKVIEDIEPAHFRLPVLLKKYIKQNARIIGFNIDPAFNQALDGFMIMKMDELPAATMQNFKR